MSRWNRRRGMAATALATITCGLAVSAMAVGPTALAAGACTAVDLTARQAGTGAGMSQPFSAISLVNTSSTPCTIKGYPTITAMATGKGKQDIKVTQGNLANISGPSPRTITLKPGGRAWFAIGAATAYDPPLVTFRSVTYSVNGSAITTTIALEATAPKGKAFPIGVTAYAAGKAPLDQS